jgi:hypothetical protein
MVIVSGNILMASESTASAWPGPTACKAGKTHPRPSYEHSGASDQKGGRNARRALLGELMAETPKAKGGGDQKSNPRPVRIAPRQWRTRARSISAQWVE